jgi:hypothetical protein
MRTAIYRHFAPRVAVLFEISSDLREETLKVGGQEIPWHRRRRIDALVVQRARKKGVGPIDLLAVEIKVSRADFLADLREPQKQAPWREVAHRHAYAAPVGLIGREEVPAGSGLLTVEKRRQWWDATWAVRAPYTDALEVPPWLTLAFAHRLSAAEGKIRGLSSDTRDSDGQTTEDLRAALTAARKRADLLDGQLERARSEAREWRLAFAAKGHLPCAHCRHPVRPVSVRRGQFTDWRHVDRQHDAACDAIRLGVSRWARIEPADDVTPQDGAA